jgi:uncharacterized protein involved in outer membrane biogenesis
VSARSRNALKWTLWMLATVIAAALLLVAVAALVDANYFRAPLVRFIAARTGRDIRIDGALKAHLLSLTPRLTADRVTIGNPPWMPPGPTAEIDRLSLFVELLPLFSRSFNISRLEMDGATLHLARDAEGRPTGRHMTRPRVPARTRRSSIASRCRMRTSSWAMRADT